MGRLCSAVPAKTVRVAGSHQPSGGRHAGAVEPGGTVKYRHSQLAGSQVDGRDAAPEGVVPAPVTASLRRLADDDDAVDHDRRRERIRSRLVASGVRQAMSPLRRSTADRVDPPLSNVTILSPASIGEE